MKKLRFPDVFNELNVSRELTAAQMQKVKQGRVQVIRMINGLFTFKIPGYIFIEFLTGNCIYKAHIIDIDSNYQIDKVFINSDPEQYKYKGNESEREQFLEILDLFFKWYNIE